MKNKILIVDDEESIHKILVRAFRDEEVEFVSAFNGLDGLQMAKSEKPALILLDINMPQMDGNETMKRLLSNEETFGIPVVMLTGNDDSVDKVVGYELGIQDYITKPFNLENLKKRVRDIIAGN